MEAGSWNLEFGSGIWKLEAGMLVCGCESGKVGCWSLGCVVSGNGSGSTELVTPSVLQKHGGGLKLLKLYNSHPEVDPQV